MATLINPSTGSQPRHSMQSRRSSRQLNRTSNVDMRASMSFGRHLNDVPQSPALGQDQQRGYSADVRRDASAPAIHTMSQDSHTKKLEAGDMTRSDSGFDDGFSDEERARLDRRVVWKTDLVMLPLMGCIVLLQYLDKAILSYAALLGLAIDLKLESNEYSWAASIYYFGLIAGLLLWTLLLQRITTDLVIGSAVVVWGIICMCHAATHNYDQILTVRFLLGFFESAITPAFILAVGQFYTERETISRTAIWYSFNGVALIIGGSMSYGLLNNPASLASSLAIWRQLYLILGGITIALGIVTLAFMPNSPAKTRLFNNDERKVAITRITTRPGHATREFFSKKLWLQSWEAVIDPRLYVIFLGLTLGSIPNGGVTAYSTQLLAGFGYTINETLLLTLAPGGAQIVSVLVFIGVSLLFKSRAVGGILLLTIAIAGSAMMLSETVGPAAHVVGYTLLNMGSPAVVTLYSFNSAAVGGHGKRVIFAAVSQLAYAAGNIIGPLTFLTEELPVYRTAKIIIVASLCGAALSLALILGIHMFWNKNRKEAGYPTRDDLDSITGEDEEDMTDFKDKAYRYVL